MRRSLIVGIVAFAMVAAALPAHAQSDAERYNIMRPEPGAKPSKPEPWLAPKYRSPRGTVQKPVPVPPPPPVATPNAAPPPPIVMPETGRVLPNLPVVPQGSVPGGKA